MRIPAALSEADAHLGLANRMALRFARRVFLAYPLEGMAEPRFRVVGRPIPARARAIPRSEAREIFELPAEGPVAARRGRARRRALDQRDGDRGLRRGRPDGAAHLGRARLLVAEEPARAADYRLIPSTDRIGAAYSACDLVRGARRQLRLGDRGRGQAGDPRARTRSRPPTTRRRTPSTSSRPAAR